MTHQPQRMAGVVIASTRAATGVYQDASAPIITEWLKGHGLIVLEPKIVPDGDAVWRALNDLLGQHPALIVTSGGTGLSADDLTPEMTLPLLERQIPGIMEAIRARGAQNTPLAALSRGYAGVNGRTLLVNLPGSSGGIRDGLAALDPLLDHLFDQLEGSHEH